MDEFEKKLQRQEFREVPGDWRAAILRAANAARPAPSAPRAPGFLSALFWPSPKAWAGLAAVWVVILGIHFVALDESRTVAKSASPVRTDLQGALKEHDRMLAELIGPLETRDVDRSKPQSPRPRSGWRDPWLKV
jgi:hypothetical protein